MRWKFSLFFLLTIGFATEKVVIIGSGPAGLTAAIYAAQSGLNPLVIEGKPCEGELVKHYNIENYPGFPEGICGECLLDKLKEQGKQFGARYEPGVVTEVTLDPRPFTVIVDSKEIQTETLIIATGSMPRKLGLEKEEVLLGKGISYFAVEDGSQYAGQDVAVVGGGDSALQDALLLAKTSSKVYVLQRGAQFSAADYLKKRVAETPNIIPVYNATISAILGEERVTGITYNEGELKVSALFIAIGRVPNTALFKGKLELTEDGLIVVAGRSSKTSIPGVFAAGDAIDPTYRKAITAAASGCVAAIDAFMGSSSR